MGSFDSAEVSELVGLYILSEQRKLIPQDRSPRLVDRLREDVVKLFKEFGLRVTTDTSLSTHIRKLKRSST